MKKPLPAAGLVLLLFGCALGGEKEGKAAEYQPETAYREQSESEAAPQEKEAAGGLLDADAIPASLPEKPAERKRIFSGYCELIVDNVAEEKERISRIAEENGGYVESVYEQSIVVRVPAGLFQEIFKIILDLGDLVHKSEETVDVSEYFRDLESRLAVAEKTRERLYILLEKTKNVEERLKILREIRRLSEEIEKIRLTLELLERRVGFSRITVQLTARLPQERIDKQTIPFKWIAGLDPLYPSLNELKGGVSLELGQEFAVFSREKIFRAESAEQTRVRIGTVKNEPAGDSAFWQKALLYHLGKYYRQSESLELEAIKAVLFTSKDRNPFYYLVGVAADNDNIQIVEIFFPDKSALDLRLEEIKESLKGIKIK